VDPRAGLDDVEKRKFLPPPGLELQPLGRPTRSQSLYRLRYPENSTLSYVPCGSLFDGLLHRLFAPKRCSLLN
jgi:hypothetical protein